MSWKPLIQSLALGLALTGGWFAGLLANIYFLAYHEDATLGQLAHLLIFLGVALVSMAVFVWRRLAN